MPVKGGDGWYGSMGRWMEEDNRGLAIIGARWLLKEGRRLGKAFSSLVVYLQTPTTLGKIRMGGNFFRTTAYEWDRAIVR